MRQYFPYYRRNLHLAFPIVLSQIGQVVVNQADIMMVGYVGTKELAAIAFANSLFIFGLVLVMGFGFGLTPIIGYIKAEKDARTQGRMLSNAYFVNVLGTFLVMILMFLGTFFLQYLGQERDVVELSKPYYYTQILSLLPFILFITKKQFAEGLGDTKHAMLVTLSGNVLNIVLNYFLIFGKWIFPEMGILGAGLATLTARVYMAVAFFLIFYRKDKFRPSMKYVASSFINWEDCKKLLFMGIPISGQMLLEVSAFSFTAIMAGWLGVVELASHQVAIGLASVTFMLAVGVGSATTIRVAHQFGEKNYKGLIMAANASTHIVLLFMGTCGVLFFTFNHFLPHFYTKDPQVVEMSALLLIAAAFFQVFDGLQLVMISILRGLGDVNRAMFYSLVAYILINLPVGYLLAFVLKMGVVGLWAGLVIGLMLASLLFYSRIRTCYKKLRIEE